MKKELIICTIIVISIIIGNIITQNYTKETINITTQKLDELKSKITQEDILTEEVKNEILEIYDEWNKRHDKLAYYIEHDELEKVETDLTSLKSFIEVQEYKEAVSELDKTIYILKHIEEKNAFNLKNIFQKCLSLYKVVDIFCKINK